MNVPFVDLKRTNAAVRPEVEQKLGEIFDENSFILGKNVKEFEQKFAEYCDSKYCIAINNGTSALHLALLALGVRKGDEVLTIPNSFFATTEAISLSGARPVFIDIENDTFTIDPSLVEKSITKKTKAIMPVNLYGQTSEMKPIVEIAEKHNLYLIDDCAQSHGALYAGRKSGSFGVLNCFSFYPTKNLGSFGEAGAIVTKDAELAAKLELLRAHGEKPKNHHSLIGVNYRLEEIQGAVLAIKLKYLDKWNDGRRNAAKKYAELLKGVKQVTLPVEKAGRKHVYHLFVTKQEKRGDLKLFLENKGVHTAIHYPELINRQPPYLGASKESLPIAEKTVKQILSLPMFYGITDEEITYTAKCVKEFYS